MPKKLELNGKTFGRLTVIREHEGRNPNGRVKWDCLCSCGKRTVVHGPLLIQGRVRSCGCLRRDIMRKNAIDITGMSYNMLTAVRRIGSTKEGKAIWLFSCSCGGAIETTAHKVVGRHTKSCGCLKNRTGAKNPRWKPSLTEKDRSSRRLHTGYGEWRRGIYEKDGYRCQVCGYNKGHTLVAHHLDGWSWCKTRRFDLTNGITLCKECHKLFHDIYTTKNNTVAQFEEFLKSHVYSAA